MKVSLAAQTLSSSVANSIEFCDRDLGLPEFRDSEAIVRFIRCIDRLFDFLNSRKSNFIRIGILKRYHESCI